MSGVFIGVINGHAYVENTSTGSIECTFCTTSGGSGASFKQTVMAALNGWTMVSNVGGWSTCKKSPLLSMGQMVSPMTGTGLAVMHAQATTQNNARIIANMQIGAEIHRAVLGGGENVQNIPRAAWRHGYCSSCKCELTPAMDGERAKICSKCSPRWS